MQYNLNYIQNFFTKIFKQVGFVDSFITAHIQKIFFEVSVQNKDRMVVS